MENGKKKLVFKMRTEDTKPTDTIGSFDIGMKNLAVCILDKVEKEPGFKIRKWKLISLVSQQGKRSLLCKHMILPRKKKGLSKKELKGHKCGKKATFWNPNSGLGYCKTHTPNDDEEIERYTTCKNISDFELCERLSEALNTLPELWDDCNEIVIESQMRSNMKKIANLIIGTIANEKKHHQDSPLENIRVVNATHKLSIPGDKLGIELPEETEAGNKNDYDGRKNLAKEHCDLLLQHDPYHYDFFQEHSKKDDLADAFLQGLWFLLSRN